MANYKLNSEENTTINNLINFMKYESNNMHSYISKASYLAFKLPFNLKQLLNNFKQYGTKTGFLLLENVNINEEQPITPPDNNYFIGEKTEYAKTITLFNQYLGEMISYEGEGYGRLFQDMVPKQSLSSTQTSLSSKVELEIHTEQAFSKLRPDVLTLGCLKGDENAITYILPVKTILNKLDDKKREMLRQPLWMIGVDLSFKMNFDEFIEGDMRGPIPIIYGSHMDPQLVFDQDLMKGINDEAEALKKEIVEIYYKYRYGHILKPGEVIFIDNRRAVHGRSSFSPRFDGTDRFIVRSFVTFDLNKSKYARNKDERVIEAKYS